jgi:hypothetical protein
MNVFRQLRRAPGSGCVVAVLERATLQPADVVMGHVGLLTRPAATRIKAKAPRVHSLHTGSQTNAS